LTVVLLAVTWSAVATASPEPLPLSAHLIRAGEFAGFRPESKTQSYSTTKAWVAGGPHPRVAQTSAEIARLHRAGFVAAVSEFLDRGLARGNGLSWVMQLRSAASARAELETQLQQVRAGSGSFSTFAVPGIPGARGYRVAGGDVIGENIFLTDGPFLHLVGQGFGSSEKNPPTRAALIAAATKLYQRVHGHPAG
jgi:hypothetical protein